MKKISLILAVIIFTSFSINLFAGSKGEKAPKAVNISGIVLDQNNQEALAGALVKIEGTDIEVYTDLEGRFSIEGIIPDTYRITCSMISYTNQEKEVEVKSSTKDIEIELQNYSSEFSVR